MTKAPAKGCHPSHVTRISDASSFDEICIHCGATDQIGSWGALAEPCSAVKVEAQPVFKRGDRVRKKSGSSWQGIVCGEYSTTLTPEGYNVESEREKGSVQLYPAAALELVPSKIGGANP